MLSSPYILAAFNAWANRRLQDTCAALTPDQVTEDRGAFFDSILGTFNHILLVDIQRVVSAGAQIDIQPAYSIECA